MPAEHDDYGEEMRRKLTACGVLLAHNSLLMPMTMILHENDHDSEPLAVLLIGTGRTVESAPNVVDWLRTTAELIESINVD